MAGRASHMELPPPGIAFRYTSSHRPAHGGDLPLFFTFAGRILCMSHAPVQHVWAAHEGGDVPPFFHLRRFILRMPSPVQHVWAGSIELLRRCLGGCGLKAQPAFQPGASPGMACVFGCPTYRGSRNTKCVFLLLFQSERIDTYMPVTQGDCPGLSGFALAGRMRHVVARSGRREAPPRGKAVIRSLGH